VDFVISSLVNQPSKAAPLLVREVSNVSTEDELQNADGVPKSSSGTAAAFAASFASSSSSIGDFSTSSSSNMLEAGLLNPSTSSAMPSASGWMEPTASSSSQLFRMVSRQSEDEDGDEDSHRTGSGPALPPRLERQFTASSTSAPAPESDVGAGSDSRSDTSGSGDSQWLSITPVSSDGLHIARVPSLDGANQDELAPQPNTRQGSFGNADIKLFKRHMQPAISDTREETEEMTNFPAGEGDVGLLFPRFGSDSTQQ